MNHLHHPADRAERRKIREKKEQQRAYKDGRKGVIQTPETTDGTKDLGDIGRKYPGLADTFLK